MSPKYVLKKGVSQHGIDNYHWTFLTFPKIFLYIKFHYFRQINPKKQQINLNFIHLSLLNKKILLTYIRIFFIFANDYKESTHRKRII